MRIWNWLLVNVFSLLMAFTSAWANEASDFDWAAEGWEYIGSDNGVYSYRKSFADSNVKGVGGATLVDASSARIVDVLMDHDHKDQWVDKFDNSRTLENPSLLSSVQYAAFTMPAIIADRDFVYRYDFRYDLDISAIVVDVKSVVHPAAPETVGVRGDIIRGVYRLYERDGGKKTWVEVEYLADPKGLLPSWIVNLVQKTWPQKTLEGLRRQVAKDFVKDHPIVIKGLEQMKQKARQG